MIAPSCRGRQVDGPGRDVIPRAVSNDVVANVGLAAEDDIGLAERAKVLRSGGLSQ